MHLLLIPSHPIVSPLPSHHIPSPPIRSLGVGPWASASNPRAPRARDTMKTSAAGCWMSHRADNWQQETAWWTSAPSGGPI